METITKDKAIRILHQKNISFFTVADAQKIFGVKKGNTLYKILQRLERAEAIKRITKGKYLFAFKEANDFELANFLLSPSYVSLESALSFYGILPQFTYTITSVTPLKPKKLTYKEKEYEYAHLEKKYFFGFAKKDNFLIALPEKALLDELYLMAKKLRNIHIDELDLTLINKKRLKIFLKNYQFSPLLNLISKNNLC